MKSSESKKSFLNKNDELNNVIKKLLLERKFTSLEFGIVSTNSKSDRKFYLLLIDNKAHLIDDQSDIKRFALQNVYTNFVNRLKVGSFHLYFLGPEISVKLSNFILSKSEKEKIENYKNNLVTYESSYLQWINQSKDKLLKDNEVKMLLSNFLHIYLKDFFTTVNNAYYLEDDFLAPIFCRSKKLEFQIVSDRRESVEKKYQKVIDLLYKRKDLLKEKMMEVESSGFLIINNALKSIAPSYYSELFEKSYKGYFSSIKKMNFDDCIHSYFKIDILDQTDDTNINLLTYYLYSNTTFLQKESHQSLFRAFELVKEKVMSYEENRELKLFERELTDVDNPLTNEELDNISIDDIDMMNGLEFEDFISYLFKQMGYTVNPTPKSGDQGIDVIVIKNQLCIGIQTKRYASSVSNKAIQEVVAGIKHYGLEKAIVITNNYFTKSAVELGLSNDVILWDRNILKEKIKNININ